MMLSRLVIFLCSLVSVACFVVPMYVIRPFRHQGAGELAVALFVRQIGPVVSIICVLIVLALVARDWRNWFNWVALAIALTGAFLARVNVYEKMFHPLGAPQFQAATDAKVEQDDMVLSVRLNNEAHAYPIREMAYHHLVNDVVGREPIVSTY